MSEFLSLQCPHCGETFETPLDVGEGNTEFIVDCEICCRPMTVTVQTRNGEIEGVKVQPC